MRITFGDGVLVGCGAETGAFGGATGAFGGAITCGFGFGATTIVVSLTSPGFVTAMPVLCPLIVNVSPHE